ncbi:MAG: phosphatidate cytidylyltransferase [Chloroflexi bacterium]|nr:phosphatidate cytidylyltransferase [Chloroflexota bacterium]
MWFSSPLNSPLLWPTFRTVGGLLGIALVALLVIERRHLRELHRRELWRRLFTWVLIAPVYVLAVLGGRIPTLLLVTVIVFQGLREYSKLVGLPRTYRWVLLGMGLLAAPAALHSALAFYALPALLLVVATLQPLVFQGQKAGVRDLAFAAFGWGYLAWLLGHFMLIYVQPEMGPGLLLALGLAVALSDVGAFTVGKLLGKHKLAPRLSPNKTWEGAAGNLVGAAIGIGLMRSAVPANFPWPLLLLLPLVVALGAVWGDLLESAIKREFQAKDAGTWLPGFGGLLDRVDSLVLVTPLVYYLAKLSGQV